MSVAQIRELAGRGITFGCHSFTHSSLVAASDAQLRREVHGAKAALQDALGCEISDFAYPYGQYDLRSRQAVAEARFRSAFGCREGLNFWNDRYSLRRTSVTETGLLWEWAFKVRTGRDPRTTARSLLRFFRGARGHQPYGE